MAEPLRRQRCAGPGVELPSAFRHSFCRTLRWGQWEQGGRESAQLRGACVRGLHKVSRTVAWQSKKTERQAEKQAVLPEWELPVWP